MICPVMSPDHDGTGQRVLMYAHGLMYSWTHGLMDSWTHGLMDSWTHVNVCLRTSILIHQTVHVDSIMWIQHELSNFLQALQFFVIKV